MKRPAAAASVSSFRLMLRCKRHAFLQAQRDAVAHHPPYRVWAARLSAERKGGKVAYSIPLQSGLSTDVIQIRVEADWTSGEECATVLVQDLKAAIAQQTCGNCLVFNIVCDTTQGPPREEGESKEPGPCTSGPPAGSKEPGACSSAVLVDMEKLALHPSKDYDADAGCFSSTFVPNLTLLYDGKPKYFETHDNGGRPFRVGVTRSSASIHANYNPHNSVDGTYEWDEAPLLAQFDRCKSVFVGVSSGSCWCDHDVNISFRFGNSILLCLEGGKSEVTVGLNPPNLALNYATRRVEPVEKFFFRRLLDGFAEQSVLCSALPSPENNRGLFTGSEQLYVFVGHCIYVFKVPDGDEIVEYYSMIGHSDVPYPVAVGKSYVYFMLDRVYVPREDISEEWLHDPVEVDEDVDGSRWEDAYRWFYEQKRGRYTTSFPSCFELAQRS